MIKLKTLLPDLARRSLMRTPLSIFRLNTRRLIWTNQQKKRYTKPPQLSPVVLLLWVLLFLVARKDSIKLIGPLLITLLGVGAWLKFRQRMNNRLSKNFNFSEFASKDGAEPTPDVLENLRKLARNLEVIRAHFGNVPIKINSGWRSPAYNKTIPNAATNSQHVKGKAADIVIKGFTPRQIASELEKLIEAKKISQGGIGVYPNFLHYDIRGKKARW